MKTLKQTLKMRIGKKRLLGFTLSEVVMTVAIISTLTAVAVPNYMRIKMNVNMEMVKQNLKTIGETMTEIMGKEKQFPSQSTWGSGTSEEEMSITANLNSINTKGYTSDEYVTDANRASYQFRTCPQEGRWGIAGDTCFLLTPEGISEIPNWQGWNRADFAIAQVQGAYCDGCFTVERIFNTPRPARREIIDWFLAQAAYSQMRMDSFQAAGNTFWEGKGNPAFYIQGASEGLITFLNNALSDPVISKALFERGVQVAYFAPTNPAAAGAGYVAATPELLPAYGFSLSDSFNPENHSGRISEYKVTQTRLDINIYW